MATIGQRDIKYFGILALGAGLAATQSQDNAIKYLAYGTGAFVLAHKPLKKNINSKLADIEQKLFCQTLNIVAVTFVAPVITSIISNNTSMSALWSGILGKAIAHAVFGQMLSNTMQDFPKRDATFPSYRLASQTCKFYLDDQSIFGKFEAGSVRSFIDLLQTKDLNSINSLEVLASGFVNALYAPTTKLINFYLGTAAPLPVKILQAAIIETDLTKSYVKSGMDTIVSYLPFR